MKVKSIIQYKFLLCILVITGLFTGCKDDADDINLPSELTARMGVPQSLLSLSSNTTVIPYVTLYATVQDPSIAEVINNNVIGLELGTTVIEIYKDNNHSKLIKKINLEVVPTATITLQPAESIDVSDIPGLKDLDVPVVSSYFSSSDNNVAVIVNDTYNSFEIQGLVPGKAYVSGHYGYSTGEKISIEVNVEKYTGEQPFPDSSRFENDLTISEVLEMMKNYNQSSHNSSDRFGSHFAESYTFSPYGNAKSITFYFNDGSSKQNLLGFVIEPSLSNVETAGYLLSNYTIYAPYSGMGIMSGLVKFKSTNDWIIESAASGSLPAWTYVAFSPHGI